MSAPDKPTMHCQAELEADLGYPSFIPTDTIFKWFEDRYSSSKHLLTLYSVARGLHAKTMVEIGFGRSSFILARAAAENNGTLLSCDVRDFSYLFTPQEKEVTKFIHGKSDEVWKSVSRQGIDFAFLDYFSSPALDKGFVNHEINTCLSVLKENGVIAVHDTIVDKYKLKNTFSKFKTKAGVMHNNKIEVLSLPFNYGLGLIRKLDPSPYGAIGDIYLKKREQTIK